MLPLDAVCRRIEVSHAAAHFHVRDKRFGVEARTVQPDAVDVGATFPQRPEGHIQMKALCQNQRVAHGVGRAQVAHIEIEEGREPHLIDVDFHPHLFFEGCRHAPHGPPLNGRNIDGTDENDDQHRDDERGDAEKLKQLARSKHTNGGESAFPSTEGNAFAFTYAL